MYIQHTYIHGAPIVSNRGQWGKKCKHYNLNILKQVKPELGAKSQTGNTLSISGQGSIKPCLSLGRFRCWLAFTLCNS